MRRSVVGFRRVGDEGVVVNVSRESRQLGSRISKLWGVPRDYKCVSMLFSGH